MTPTSLPHAATWFFAPLCSTLSPDAPPQSSRRASPFCSRIMRANSQHTRHKHVRALSLLLYYRCNNIFIPSSTLFPPRDEIFHKSLHRARHEVCFDALLGCVDQKHTTLSAGACIVWAWTFFAADICIWIASVWKGWIYGAPVAPHPSASGRKMSTCIRPFLRGMKFLLARNIYTRTVLKTAALLRILKRNTAH